MAGIVCMRSKLAADLPDTKHFPTGRCGQWSGAVKERSVFERPARRRCQPLLLQNQIQGTRRLQEFEPATPRRGPKVLRTRHGGILPTSTSHLPTSHTSQLPTSEVSSRSGNRWIV